MSANIQDNQLAYVGQVPWHGLGVQVPEGATGAEMLQLAGLNWKVQRRNIAMRAGDGSGKMLIDPLKGYRAIVRQDTNRVFQVATERYFPVQNEQIVEFFRDYCEAGNATMETVGAINGGSTVWALAKVKADADLSDEDKLKGYLLLATAHDGSIKTIGQPTVIRVVCNNTLSAAISEKSKARFAMKHTRKWSAEVAKEAKAIMGMAIEQIQETNALAAQFTKIRLDEKDWFKFVSDLSGTKEEPTVAVADDIEDVSQEAMDAAIAHLDIEPDFDLDKLNRVGKAIYESTLTAPGQDLSTAKGTAWGVLNGVTHFVDHVRSRTQDTRLQNGWFGSGDSLKTQAVLTLKEMAGIR